MRLAMLAVWTCVCLCVLASHIEDLRYLWVIEEVLLLVVFLEHCCIVVPALFRRVRAGMGMLPGLQSDKRREERRKKGGGGEEKMRKMKWDANTKCKVGGVQGQMQGGREGRHEEGKGPRTETDQDSMRDLTENILKNKGEKTTTKECSVVDGKRVCVYFLNI